MPEPTLLSPNTGNYQVGKGVVTFKKEGESTFRDLGNVTSMALTPDLTTLDHFSSRAGTKKKDLVIVLEKKATVKIAMDEVTAANVALMVLGSVDESAVGGPEVQIFDQNAVNGWLRFDGQNEVGAQCLVDLYNVSFLPSGEFQLISDEFNNMEATADVQVAGITPAVAAKGVYTASALADADTVVIGGVTYTFDSTLAATPNHVHRTGVLATDLANLAKAINDSGVEGTDYGAGTVAHATVSAVSGASTLTATAKTGGTAGNAIATTDTATGGAWGAATLTGGAAEDATNEGKFGVIKFKNVTPAA